MQSNDPHIILTFSGSAFHRLILQGVVVDGRAGGLLVGRSVFDGGIPVIRQQGEWFHLQIQRAEDGDFVLHPGAAPYQVRKPRKQGPGTQTVTQMLFTKAAPYDRILWLIWHQQIIPAESAWPRLEYLSAINEEENSFLRCDMDDVFNQPEHAWTKQNG